MVGRCIQLALRDIVPCNAIISIFLSVRCAPHIAVNATEFHFPFVRIKSQTFSGAGTDRKEIAIVGDNFVIICSTIR